MFNNLLSQMQAQTEEIKKKLDTLRVEAEIENGLVKVTADGNKKIIDIQIDPTLFDDKEAMEDLVVTAVNKALEKSGVLFEKEMGAMAKGMLPGLGNMFGKG